MRRGSGRNRVDFFRKIRTVGVPDDVKCSAVCAEHEEALRTCGDLAVVKCAFVRFG